MVTGGHGKRAEGGLHDGLSRWGTKEETEITGEDGHGQCTCARVHIPGKHGVWHAGDETAATAAGRGLRRGRAAPRLTELTEYHVASRSSIIITPL